MMSIRSLNHCHASYIYITEKLVKLGREREGGWWGGVERAMRNKDKTSMILNKKK